MSKRVTHVPCAPFANESERRALEYLRQRLIGDETSGTWVLLTNLCISFQAGARMPYEIDILAIGSSGIVVVEVKHWDRRYVESVANSDGVRAEALKAQRKAQILKSRLKSIPMVQNLFIPAKLLLTGAERERFSGASTVTSLSGVPAYGIGEWQELLGCQQARCLSDGEIASVLTALNAVIPRASHPRMTSFGDYLECEPAGTSVLAWRRTYRARRATTGDRVVLHIYDLSAASEPEALNVATREYEAVRLLQKLDSIPAMMETFQPVPGFTGEMYYFSYSEPVATPLAKKVLDNDWSTADRAAFAQACLEQLAEIHQSLETAVLHRRISPETVLVRSDNRPVFTGFEFARIPGTDTVAGAAPQNEVAEWIAPELVVGGLDLASTKSDVYALTTVLKQLFVERTDPVSDSCMRVLARGQSEKPEDRPELAQLATLLQEELVGSVTKSDQKATEQLLAPEFWDEATIRELNGRRYRIVQPLGKGHFGYTFKVEEIDTHGEPVSGPYVAKAITHPEYGAVACRAYGQVRAQTGGTALAGVLEVASEWQVHDITALLKWIDGDSLNTFLGVLPIHFEDHGVENFEAGLRQWILDLLDGLLVLHKSGLVHGDVSPRNIIVHELNVTLTDYDLARREGEPAGGGTGAYCAPEVDQRAPLCRSADVYALAATMFHVAFEVSPFMHARGMDKAQGLNWPEGARERVPTLSTFFDRATSLRPEERFATADEAISFLAKEPEITKATIPAAAETSAGDFYQAEVPWLAQLLQTHPASPYGNPETRGLDSEFARKTYVETALDHKLATDLRKGAVKLVFLCGNAGDGKTAFLQNLADNLGAPRETSIKRIWDFRTEDGIRVKINLDGAASYEGRSAQDILTSFLAQFRDGIPENGSAHLVAINDGPLLAWVESQEESWLTEQIEALLDDASSEIIDPRIRFIDLNQRSLVGNLTNSDIETPTFLNRLLDKMLGPEDTWKPCVSCVSQDRCPAWQCVSDLRDPPKGLFIRQQLARLLQVVHQRGEIHITARLLRSALSFGFFGTEYCTDIHRQTEKKRFQYWDRFFSPSIPFRQGDLLDELTKLDPALESHPQVDRTLMAEPPRGHELELQPEELLDSRRRRAFFTWSKDKLPKAIDDEYALDTIQLRRLKEFQSLVDSEKATQLCRRICDGVSRMQDLPDAAFRDEGSMPVLVTPRTPTETVFWVLKPRTRFHLSPAIGKAAQDLDFLPTQVVLTYTFANGHVEKLFMGLTLFSLLLDVQEGYQLTNSLSDDTFANLAIFSQRLAQEDQQTLYAWNPSDPHVLRIGARKEGEDGSLRQVLYLERKELTPL